MSHFARIAALVRLNATCLPRLALPLGLMTLTAAPLAAQTTVLNGDYSVVGNLCVGSGCTNAETFPSFVATKFKAGALRTYFEDTTTEPFYPANDWELVINDIGEYGEDYFAIRDVDANGQVFRINSGAPTNSFFMDSAGQIGLGTSLPQAELHVEGGAGTNLRLSAATTDNGPRSFDLGLDKNGIHLRNTLTGVRPISINNDAPAFGLVVGSSELAVNNAGSDYNFRVFSEDYTTLLFTDSGTKKVGIGTGTPEELLHIQTNTANTDAFALFDAAGAGSDAAFRLRQNGTTPSTWEFRNQQSSGRLNVGIAGGNTPLKIDNAANNNLMRLGRNGKPGEVNITGTLVVNNSQMNVPDYVFADDYALRPLADVQAFIDANSHLPDVPSEADIKANGVDMTQMQMVLLKKVEELTLYTLEQDRIIAAQARTEQARDAEMSALRDQFAALHALVTSGVSQVAQD